MRNYKKSRRLIYSFFFSKICFYRFTTYPTFCYIQKFFTLLKSATKREPRIFQLCFSYLKWSLLLLRKRRILSLICRINFVFFSLFYGRAGHGFAQVFPEHKYLIVECIRQVRIDHDYRYFYYNIHIDVYVHIQEDSYYYSMTSNYNF